MEQVDALLAFSGGSTEGYAYPHAKWLFKTTYPVCADFTRLFL